jgi:hypothetical protein
MNEYAVQGLVMIILLGLAVLVPITGMTVRFMLRPFLDERARKRVYDELKQEGSLIEKRLALLEQQFDSLERGLSAIQAEREFDKELQSVPVIPKLRESNTDDVSDQGSHYE